MKNKNVSTKTIIAPICALLLLLGTPGTSSAATINGEKCNSIGIALVAITLTAAGTFVEKRLDRKFKKNHPFCNTRGYMGTTAMVVPIALWSAKVQQHSYWLYDTLINVGEVGFGTAIGLALDWLLESRKTEQERERENREKKEAYLKIVCPALLPLSEDLTQ